MSRENVFEGQRTGIAGSIPVLATINREQKLMTKNVCKMTKTALQQQLYKRNDLTYFMAFHIVDALLYVRAYNLTPRDLAVPVRRDPSSTKTRLLGQDHRGVKHFFNCQVRK